MEKLVNIANDLQVIVSEYKGTLMLELRGGFKPQRISASKVQFILEHSVKLGALVNDSQTKENLYQLGTDSSVYVSSFQGTAMYELRGQFRPVNISVNKIKAVLKYAKEVRNILTENTSATVVAEQTAKATKELAQNSATIGTDKKSAKDKAVPVAAPVVTEKKQESLTIVEYLMRELNLTASESLLYKSDKDAIAMYESYKAAFSPVAPKVLSFAERMAKDGISIDKRLTTAHVAPVTGTATEKTKAQTAKLKKEAKQVIASIDKTLAESAPKTRGIPVSFTVKIGGKERTIIDESIPRALNQLTDKKLQKGENEQKLFTAVPIGAGPNKYFYSWMKQGYFTNVVDLRTNTPMTIPENLQ